MAVSRYQVLSPDKPFASQVSGENTYYEIRDEFDLQGKTVKIPSGCTLCFKGGLISNGVLNGNSTAIEAPAVQIFGENLKVNSDEWNIDYSYPEWYGAVPDGKHDCLSALDKAVMMNHYVKLNNGTYAISGSWKLPSKVKVMGNKEHTVIAPLSSDQTDEYLVGLYATSNSRVSGFLKDFNIKDAPNIGLKCNYLTRGFTVEGLQIKNCKGAGMFVSKSWYAIYRDLYISSNKYGVYIQAKDNDDKNEGAVNAINFENCWLNANTENALYVDGITCALSFTSCTFENSKTGPEIYCKNLYPDISFYSCYIETRVGAITVAPSYRVGSVSFYGGYIQEHNDVLLADIGKLNQFVMLGTFVTAPSKFTQPSYIRSDASYNVISARLPFDNVPSFNDGANVVDLGSVKNDSNQRTKGNTFNKLPVHQLQVLDNSGSSQESEAKISLGSSKLANVKTNNGAYRLELKQNKKNNCFDVVVISNVNGKENRKVVATISDKGVRNVEK